MDTGKSTVDLIVLFPINKGNLSTEQSIIIIVHELILSTSKLFKIHRNNQYGYKTAHGY